MPQLTLVLTIGQYAQAFHLGSLREKTLTATVENWRGIFDATSEPKQLPLPHPSWRNTGWLKRNPWFEADLLPVLRHEVRMRIKHDG
jgi:uracil-DNA glycosylase